MSTALLTRTGKYVVVDDGIIGSGESGRTTVHLTAALDDRYFELERLHGTTGTRLAAASHTAAINQIESMVAHEGIDCDFERLDGYVFVPLGVSTDVLEHELTAAQRAGLGEVRLLSRAPLPFVDTGPCIHFPRQAQFYPLKYLTGLAGSIQAGGGHIFTETHATEMTGRVSGHVTTRTGATITAETIVVATHTPINDRVILHTKQAPYRTYVIGLAGPLWVHTQRVVQGHT